MDINASMEQLGNFGFYQLYVYLLSCLPNFVTGIIFFSLVFLSATPDYRCYIPNCDPGPQTAVFRAPYMTDEIQTPHKSCERLVQIPSPENSNLFNCSALQFTNTTETCDHFVFDTTDFISTVVTEFKKVCSDSYQISMGQSIFYLGSLTGAVVFGFLSDRYGRLTVFKTAPILALVTSIVTAMAPNFLVFTLSSAITSGCIVGMCETSFIIGIEFIGGKWRLWCGNFLSVVFSFGSMALCITAYYVREWRHLQMLIAIPLIFILFYPWIFPESVRWQASNGQTNKAIEAIRKAAKWNKVYIHEEQLYGEEIKENENLLVADVGEYGPLDLFKNKITRKWTLSLFFLCLSLQAGNIGSNIYISFILLSAAEIPGVIASTFLTQMFGRKKVLCGLYLVGGLSCAAPAILPDDYGTAFAIFGKCNITGAFALIWVYTVEIFPTVLRNSGLGMCSFSARFGGILAPQLIELAVLDKSLPQVISGLLTVIAGFMVLVLPETHNRQLPETLQDLKTFNE